MSGYRRSGPSPLLIIVVGALVVFGGYYVWSGFLSFLEDQGDLTAQVTREAMSTATAGSVFQPPAFPTSYQLATFTPLPPCITFVVNVERAVYRECPAQDNTECPVIDVVPEGTEFCVYARVSSNPEWFVIDLNPGGAYRDIVYMHESVIEALNPTPTPTATFTPAPTITQLPSSTPTPTLPPSPSHTPDPAQPSLTPMPEPSNTPTPPHVTI